MRNNSKVFSFIVLIVLGIGLFSSSGCSSMKKKANALIREYILEEHVAPAPVPKQAPANYKDAYAALLNEQYVDAAAKFEELLREEPVSPWTQAANLNLARAYEGQEKWQQAADTYRAVVAATENSPKLQAAALYRLSFCHEALGDEQQVVAVLSDLLARSQYLSDEIRAAELPARLGAAYARVGNFDRAVEFYRKAEVGIARLRQESKTDVPDWLPRTLYFMGEMSRRQLSWTTFETSLRPLTRSQVYLLQAAELEKAPWAAKASSELIAVYRDLINVVETAPDYDGEPLLAGRERQSRQWDKSVLILDAIAELRARAVPKVSSASPSVAAVLVALDEVEKRVHKLLLERPLGEGVTRDSSNRANRMLPMVVSPAQPIDHSLEDKFIESSREIKPIKLPTKSEDPNL